MNDLWNSIETSVEDYAPQVLAALVILAVGWLIATLVAAIVRRVLHRTDLDERIARSLGARDVSSTESGIASATFWIIMLLVAIAALEALELDTVTRPLTDAVDDVLGFLPNLIGAAVILLIGYVIARILRGIVENVSAAVGADRLGTQAGISPEAGTGPRLSETIGLIVFALVLIPTIIAALNALRIDAVAGPTSRMLDRILVAVPNIFAAMLLMAIAYLVARIVARLVAGILAGLGFNTLPARMGMDPVQARVGGRTPSEVAGALLFTAIMLIAALEAAELLGFVALASLITAFLVYFGQVLVGLVIIGIGFWLANLVATAIRTSGVARASLLATIGRVAVIVLAVAIGLGEMGIADEIVILAFGLPLAAAALGLAIGLGVAVGIGGRDVARQELDNARRALRGEGSAPGT